MARILHTVAVENQVPGADGIFTHDLPVQALSAVIVVLRPLNETATLSNFAEYRTVVQAINTVDIRYRGSSIVSMRGEDAAMMALLRHGFQAFEGGGDDADNNRRAVPVPIMLGRAPWHPTSCFPATRRGELTISLDLDIADTGYDGLQYTIETIELLDVNPTEFERKVQIARTFAATGLNDIDLPLGNLYRGLLLFGTSAFTGTAPAPTWGRISVQLEDQEIAYSATDWEVARTLAGFHKGTGAHWGTHIHRVDATAAATTQPTFSTIAVENDYQLYAYLELDPTDDDLYAIDTADRTRFHIEANVEAADAARVVPVERVLL